MHGRFSRSKESALRGCKIKLSDFFTSKHPQKNFGKVKNFQALVALRFVIKGQKTQARRGGYRVPPPPFMHKMFKVTSQGTS